MHYLFQYTLLTISKSLWKLNYVFLTDNLEEIFWKLQNEKYGITVDWSVTLVCKTLALLLDMTFLVNLSKTWSKQVLLLETILVGSFTKEVNP